jgi:purine-binding chemotaxis protein CheW
MSVQKTESNVNQEKNTPETKAGNLSMSEEGTAAASPPEELKDPAGDVVEEDEEQLVVFTLAGEHYGVDIAVVASIIKPQPITVVPRAPEFIEGITNLRGTVLPVVDLHRRFGLPTKRAEQPPLSPPQGEEVEEKRLHALPDEPRSPSVREEETDDSRIVVVEIDSTQVGLMVDTVTEVLRIPAASIEPPSPIVSTVDSAFIAGIAKVGGYSPERDAERLIILLDLDKVLSPEGQVNL